MRNRYLIKGKWDNWLVLPILVMLFIGIVMVYSASYFEMDFKHDDPSKLIIKELIFALVGLFSMWFISKIDHKRIRSWAVIINVLTWAAYALLLTPLGQEFHGGLRWVMIGGFTLMPSELAKYAGIVAVAYVMTAGKRERNSRSYLFLVVCPLAYVLFTLLQPDLSTAIVIAVSAVGVLFFAGLNLFYVFILAVLGISGVLGLILFVGYRSARLSVFLDPFIDPLGKGYQTIQSLYAVASGGLQGAGIGNGKQKMLYLPLSYNDYIFSIYAEELGFIGCIVLIMLLSIIVFRGLKIAANAPDKFSALAVGGIIVQLGIQSIMNMYVSVNLVPSTGIPFPIISYGGTSLIVTLAAIGFVLGVSRYESAKKTKAFENIENKSYHALERQKRNG